MKFSRLFLIVLALLALALCASHVRADQHGRHHGGNSGQHAQPAHPHGSSGQYAVPRAPYRDSGRYDSYRYRNGGPRPYSRRFFPRSYGFGYYDGYRYHGMWFRPNYRYWNGFNYFYWPWYDAPRYGCGWYWLPTHREPEPPPEGYEGEEGWGYDDWGWVYVCVD